MGEVSLRIIGRVRNSETKECKHAEWSDVESEIILEPELAEALDGIEDYSHLVIVFWMHLIPENARLLKKVVPYELDGVGEMGVLATRMRERPNPIGLSIVELVSCDKNVLVVQGLDAFNDTPVLDIKPFTGHSRDLIDNFRVPEWDKKD